MQTKILSNILSPELTQEADNILRSCVHCGFCTATCPTYQIFSDELDGPRGRIYLIKQMLEGETVTTKTLTHLDRCLTCRSCETTCPSGVQYSRLLDIGKNYAEKEVNRSVFQIASRKLLLAFLLSKKMFNSIIKMVQPFVIFFPKKYQAKIKISKTNLQWPSQNHKRKILLLTGCAQDTFAPNIDKQLAHLLHKCNIQTIPFSGCCGALPQHLSAEDKAVGIMKNNIVRWISFIESNKDNRIEAITMSSSGCGISLKEYKKYLAYDNEYRNKAEQISNLVKDPIELLEKESSNLIQKNNNRISFHAPCTLQHGLAVHTKVESLLTALGYTLNIIKDSHLCCGSAGSHSILQPKISQQLLSNKITALEESEHELIATSNIGCLMHLNSAAKKEVKHWLSMVYENLK